MTCITVKWQLMNKSNEKRLLSNAISGIEKSFPLSLPEGGIQAWIYARPFQIEFGTAVLDRSATSAGYSTHISQTNILHATKTNNVFLNSS